MKHIVDFKLFESEETKTKILFLHGLDSKPFADRIEILENSISPKPEVISPHINYRTDDFVKIIEDIIEKNGILPGVGFIMGHSYGGILAHYFSNKYKIPALMFNPAFRPENIDYIETQSDLKKYDNFHEQYAVVGMDDNVIIPEVQISACNKRKIHIWKQDGLGHRIDPTTFKKHVSNFIDVTNDYGQSTLNPLLKPKE